MQIFPPLFLSHGAPNMGLHDTDVRRFMLQLGDQFEKPDAIVVISAHFETKNTVVVSDPNPGMIYDFRGFEPELYEMNYPAPGNPALASEVASLLKNSNVPVSLLESRGYDHGTWVPLSLLWPEADIPVVQLSIDPEQGPDYHFKVGRALAELPARNIAIVGTGNITHNLPALFSKGRDPELDANIKRYVDQFLAWFDSEIESGDFNKLLNYRENAPFAEENHPTDEHLLPIFVSMGAAGQGCTPEKIHQSYQFDFLAMDAWKFSPTSIEG